MKRRILSLIAATALALGTGAANVETDRAWYLAGEAMRVIVTTEGSPAGTVPLIAYAELCDTQGLAAGVVVSLQEGTGEGVIQLPADLHSGYYILSAYTRADTLVSHRLVAVVNPLRKSKDDDIEWVRITPSDSLSHAQGQGRLEFSPVREAGELERDGHLIRARVRRAMSGPASSGQVLPSLSIIGKQIHYFEGKMVGDSMAVFNTFGVHGRQPLVLSAMSSAGESLPIEMSSPFAVMLPRRLPHLVFHYQRSEVEARSLDMQRRQPAEDPVPSDYDDTVAGTKPDLTYNLDEYRQFLTVREVLVEYVNCVVRRKTDNVTKLFVCMELEHFNSSVPSLVLIDGMPVYDTEQLLGYDARRIHYINIYGGQYTFGHGIYNGILSFVTRSGQLTNYPTDRNAQYLEYEFPE